MNSGARDPLQTPLLIVDRHVALDCIVGSGIGYLRGKLGESQAGLWRDFKLEGVSEGSTEWLSAFMALQLATIPEARALALEVVLALLAASRPSAGWGYRSDVSEDCDSTACVVLAASALGITFVPAFAQRAIAFILKHQSPDGGFATYADAARPSIMREGRRRWFMSETSVTANSVLALQALGFDGREAIESAKAFLLGQCRDGLWDCLWCKGSSYSTFQVLEALRSIGARPDDVHAEDAVARLGALRTGAGGWACITGMEQDAYSSAFALRILLSVRREAIDTPLVAGGIDCLARYQTALGNFVPAVQMLAPGGLNGMDIVIQDQGLITTACALRAVNDYRSLLSTPG